MVQSAIRNPQSAIRKAPLLVVSGPSGVGKTTAVLKLLEAIGPVLRRAVTATTRPPRPGEMDGWDYHFWTADRFRSEIAAGHMLEHAEYGGQMYGTPLSEVEPYRAAGVGVVLVIDVQGAAQVRARFPGDHCSVFLRPPSWAVLEERLRNRNTEDADRLARRLATARDELARAAEFDRQVTNDSLDAAVRDLAAVVQELFDRGC